MSRNTTILLAVVVLLILGGWYFISSQKTESPSTAPQVSPQQETEATDEALMEDDEGDIDEMTVEITSSGFMPKDIVIKVGESVTWMNEDSADHQVNSAPHPTHTTYKPLNTLGALKAGEKKLLTFPEAGTYKYHDHLNPSLTGVVTVE